MPSPHKIRITLALSAAALILSPHAQAQPSAAQAPAVAQAVLRSELEATKLSASGGFALSPDGRWFAYGVSKADVTTNRSVFELRLRRRDAAMNDTRVVLRRETDGAAATAVVRFAPDSRSLAFIDPADRTRLRVIDLESGTDAALAPTTEDYSAITDFAWSPDAKRLALLVNQAVVTPPLLHGVSVSPEWNHRAPLTLPNTDLLLVVERTGGAVASRSQPGYSLQGLDWSPAGDRIAVAGYLQATSGQGSYMDGQIRTRVGLFDIARESLDFFGPVYSDGPRFSPDGRTLAFRTNVDGDIYKAGQVGVYRVADGRIERFGEAWPETPQGLEWLDDKTLIGRSFDGLGCSLQRIDIATRRVASLDGPNPTRITCDRAPVVSHARREILFQRDHFTKMSDLWVSPIDRWSPQQLTDLNPALNAQLDAAVDTRVLEWPSRDGRYQIHGLLLTPKGKRGPFPLIASVTGGPSPVVAWIMGDGYGQHLNQPSLAAGHAILLPVTRGRGGYGRAFDDAMRANADYVAGPLSDVLEGVALVERMGVAKPDQTAWMGFSYGASMGAYAITQTDKFKVALLGDTGEQDYLNTAYRRIASYGHHVAMSIAGAEDPFTPEGIEKLRSFSSVTYLPQAKTPTMLQCGVLAPSAQQGCIVVFQGLSYFKVPTEMVMYPRTGHGITEPALQYDAELKRLAWFDRWMAAPRWAPVTRP